VLTRRSQIPLYRADPENHNNSHNTTNTIREEHYEPKTNLNHRLTRTRNSFSLTTDQIDNRKYLNSSKKKNYSIISNNSKHMIISDTTSTKSQKLPDKTINTAKITLNTRELRTSDQHMHVQTALNIHANNMPISTETKISAKMVSTVHRS
jgi:exonuclease VII large subunit